MSIDNWLTDWPECPRCKGKATILLADVNDNFATREETCPECNGKGQVEGGMQAIEKMGWPEWEHHWDKCRCVLGRCSKGICVDRYCSAHDTADTRGVAPHVALCLLRDKAREWLVEHNAHMRLYPNGWEAWWLPPGTQTHQQLTRRPDHDIDVALVRAILATGETT